jgi:hypothetical protein
MNDFVNLTISLGGTLYFGQWNVWRAYASALVGGRIAAYRQSPAYHNQSLTEFFRLFRSTWNRKQTPMPNPEEYGLIALRPENATQSQIIDELLKA